jgi:hypothetical protein
MGDALADPTDNQYNLAQLPFIFTIHNQAPKLKEWFPTPGARDWRLVNANLRAALYFARNTADVSNSAQILYDLDANKNNFDTINPPCQAGIRLKRVLRYHQAVLTCFMDRYRNRYVLFPTISVPQ